MDERIASGTGTEVWGSTAWRELAVAWLDARLAEAGLQRTGEVEQPHLRPWATTLWAPTTGGPVWLKATGGGTRFEVRLYELLDRVVPERVLTPLATDTDRGWILLPDGGRSVGETFRDDALLDALLAILPEYGQLQRDLAPHAAEMVAFGVPDMRPVVMPRRFDEALAGVRDYVTGRDSDADRETYRQVATLRAPYQGWCERLAAMPGGASLDHNDLHPWNMLVGDSGGPSGYVFYDWGDSVVAHPFVSMYLPLGFARRQLGAALDDPRLLHLRDAYLEVFSDVAPYGDLVAALDLACTVGKVARALTWQRALRVLGPDDRAEYASAPLASLSKLLDESYLAGGWSY